MLEALQYVLGSGWRVFAVLMIVSAFRLFTVNKGASEADLRKAVREELDDWLKRNRR